MYNDIYLFSTETDHNRDNAYYGTFSKLGYGFIAFADKLTTVSIFYFYIHLKIGKIC